MSEDKDQIFTKEQKRELDRVLSLIKERDMEIVDILEAIQIQQKNGQYDYNIEKKIDRLRAKIEKY